MDSPPECVLALSCEQPRSPSTLPSLDHSPLASSPAHLSLPSSPLALPLHSPEASPLSSDTAPYFALSPFALHQEDGHHQEDPHHHHLLLRHHEEEEEEDDDDEGDVEGRDGAPPSPTPAVALFPGGGGTQEVRFSPGPESSPPATPLAPLLGFGALELALASGQGGSCNDELDLQLFQKDAVAGVLSAVGGASSAVPALRFPCLVCGKRFRFQSILSLHARAHSLDRERRAAPLYRSGLSQAAAQPHLKALQNHKDIAVQNKHNLQDQRPFPATLIQHLTEEEEEEDEEGEEEGEEGRGLEDVLHMEKRQNCLLDGNVPLTPPLTEDPVSLLSPYPSASAPAVVTAASAYRCHACKGKFRTASELERHVRILHNPYKCTLCAFSASQEESLAAHLQECHPSPRATLAPSPIYSSRAIIAATPDTPVPTPTPTPAPTPAPGAPQTAAPTLPAFRCDTCGQRFTQSWFLKGHMRKHKDSLDHKCQVCGRGFREPWFLKNHMKVHLNKLGLKAGLGGLGVAVGAEQQASGPVSSQSLSALYSSLLLAQRRGAGGGGRGGRGRSERDPGGRGMVPGSGKSAILGYLGLPIDGGGASCMERLQAVAQVAEMGGVSSSVGGGSGAGDAGSRAGGTAEAVAAAVADGGEQAAMWQLVARSLLAAQQAQQQRGHQQSQRGPSRTPIIGEADQVRAYLGGLDPRQESASSAGVEGGGGGGSGGPWECPDCGKLFRSLQQVVVHARVHVQRPQKGGGEESSGSGRATGKSGRGKAKLQSPGLRQAASASGFHSVISSLHGENGLPAVSSMATGPSRERVRGSGVKDCPYCGKAFRSSHHLKVHLRVHTGERPYKCPHCDYAGTQSGSLKYHLQRHHREQRNALSASSSSASSSTSSNNSPTISSLAPGAPSRRDGPGKQGRSQGRQGSQGSGHSQGSRGLTDTPISRHHQQPWLLGVTDHQRGQQKTLAALQEVDVETQYRYLSGVMGALYQGGLEGGWIRESPPLPKTPKVSRRKPLTTSRMVQLSNGSDKEGAAPPVTLEGGFEPLDLSRRPSPGPGGGAEYGGSVCVGVNRGGEPRAVDTLNQCLFCPFRTSSAELMAMHLQVNHTSKSRRKRGPSAAPDHEGPSRPRQPRMDHADPDPMAAWRYASQAEDQELTADWASSQSQSHNGFSESRVEPRGGPLDQQGSSLASVSGNFHRSQVDEEEEEENMKDDEDEDEEGEGDLEPPEENSSPVGSPGETGPPLLGFEHIMREEGGVVTD